MSFYSFILSVLRKRITILILFVFCVVFCFNSFIQLNSEIENSKNKTKIVASFLRSSIQIGDAFEIEKISNKVKADLGLKDIFIESESLNGLNNPYDQFNPSASVSSYPINLYNIITKDLLFSRGSFNIFKGSRNNSIFFVKIVYQNNSLYRILVNSTILTLLFIIILLFFMIFLASSLSKSLSKPLNVLSSLIEGYLTNNNDQKLLGIEEIDLIYSKFLDLQNKVDKKNLEILEKSKNEERGRLAAQIAHDLNSFVSQIKQIVSLINFESINLDKKVLLNSVLFDLTSMMNKILRGESQAVGDKDLKVIIVRNFIIEIFQQKKIEYSEDGITFEIELDLGEYFIKCDPVMLKASISNIINNSIESFHHSSNCKIIKLELTNKDNILSIKISDNGSGIRKDLLNKVLEEGASTKGKNRGRGLSGAKENIEKMGGTLFVESELNDGTSIYIKFISEKPPRWFYPLDANSHRGNIYIFSDLIPEHTVSKKLFQIEDQEELLDLIKFNKLNQNDLILIDEEKFSELPSNNLDFSKVVILLKSYYPNTALKNKFKLSTYEYFKQRVNDSISTDLIFIDDDKINRLIWDKIAKKHGFRISMYSSIEDFEKSFNEFDRQTPIYIDSDLGGELTGEIYAKKLFDDFGFKHIRLATGHEPTSFDKMYWIEEVCGKGFPLDSLVIN